MDFSPEPFLKMRSQMPSEVACSVSSQLWNSVEDLKVSIFKRFLAGLVSEVPGACRHLAHSASAHNVDVEMRMACPKGRPVHAHRWSGNPFFARNNLVVCIGLSVGHNIFLSLLVSFSDRFNGTFEINGGWSGLGLGHGAHLATGGATAVENAGTVALQLGHGDAGGHLDALEDFACLRIDTPCRSAPTAVCCRRCASSSLRRVSSFSALSSSNRNASRSSRVPMMCLVIVCRPYRLASSHTIISRRSVR
jgi:hypothetical protein